MILALFDHPNIVKIRDVVLGDSEWYFMHDELESTGPAVPLKARFPDSGTGFDEPTVLRVAEQLISAIDYCHHHNVYHGNINADTVLVSGDWGVKLADFSYAGMSKIPSGSYAQFLPWSKQVGMADYITTPHGYQGSYYIDSSFAGDIWQYGIVLSQMLNGNTEFGLRVGDINLGQIVPNTESVSTSKSLSYILPSSPFLLPAPVSRRLLSFLCRPKLKFLT